MLTAQRRLQFVADDLHHLLGRRERAHDLVGEGTRADPSEEIVDHVQSDVAVQKCGADVVERRLDLLRV